MEDEITVLTDVPAGYMFCRFIKVKKYVNITQL